VFYKEWNEHKTRAIVIFILSLIVLTTTVALRPYASSMMEQMVNELEEMPEFLQKMIGDPSIAQKLTNDEYYINSQWHGKNLGQFLPIFVLIIAFPVFAREVDKKTIYFLLSRRKREEVFWKKFFVGYFVITAIIVIFSLAGPIAMKIAGYQVGFRNTGLILVHEIVGVSFFYSLFILFSVLSNDQVKPVVGGLVVIIALPFLSLIESIAFLNPYPYILGLDIINGSGIDWWYTLSLAVLTLVIAFQSYRIFKTKEF